MGSNNENVSKSDIETVVTSLVARIDGEFRTMSEGDVSSRWYYSWDEKRSIAQNIYDFYDMLRLHQSSCRRWEEIHNGSCCVVERVRDKYLMPRIREFEAELRKHLAQESA